MQNYNSDFYFTLTLLTMHCEKLLSFWAILLRIDVILAVDLQSLQQSCVKTFSHIFGVCFEQGKPLLYLFVANKIWNLS